MHKQGEEEGPNVRQNALLCGMVLLIGFDENLDFPGPAWDTVERVSSRSGVSTQQIASAQFVFDLDESSDWRVYAAYHTPVFVEATLHPLQGRVPEEGLFLGVCGWPGFLSRPQLEVSVRPNQYEQAQEVLRPLGIPVLFVPDQAGLVTPRILATIINEAYHVWGEGLATAADIDIAMKLGTNYPHGPLEWAQKIGTQRILALLEALAKEDPARYQPAARLWEEAGF